VIISPVISSGAAATLLNLSGCHNSSGPDVSIQKPTGSAN